MKILPRSNWGRAAVGLIVLMGTLVVAGGSAVQLYEGVEAGKSIAQDITARPLVALTMLAGFAAGLLSLVSSSIALIKDKDRAVLVFVALAIGLLIVAFLVGEIVAPH